MHKCSNAQMLKCSNAHVKCTNGQMLKRPKCATHNPRRQQQYNGAPTCPLLAEPGCAPVQVTQFVVHVFVNVFAVLHLSEAERAIRGVQTDTLRAALRHQPRIERTTTTKVSSGVQLAQILLKWNTGLVRKKHNRRAMLVSTSMEQLQNAEESASPTEYCVHQFLLYGYRSSQYF